METQALRDAYRYCEWINAHHYENFPVGSWLLPPRARPHVAAVYAFARSADDFADERKYEGRSLELLARWRAALKSCDPTPVPGTGPVPGTDLDFHPIFLALADTIRRFDLPVQLLDDLLTAFAMDVTKRRYADWEELMSYCRHSANPVGRLVLHLCGIRDPQLHAYSDSICTGLQLANHWQDLRIDMARGILYIPKALMDQHKLSEADLAVIASPQEAKQSPGLAPGAASSSPAGTPRSDGFLDPRFCSLMQDLVRRARGIFDAGEPLVSRLSGGLRLEIKLTLLGGRAILDRIEKAQYDVFRRRPVLSGLDKTRLLTHAFLSMR